MIKRPAGFIMYSERRFSEGQARLLADGGVIHGCGEVEVIDSLNR